MVEVEENTLEIAVIGMAGRYPGAKDINEFWDNLKNGIESIAFFGEEELIKSGIAPGLLEDSNYVKAYGMLEGIEYFDAAFFGYTPKEAEIMDPQMRIFHECAWTALEDAGYNPMPYDGLIGLYAGATTNLDWQARVLLSGKSEEIGYFAAGHVTRKDFLSLRVSYKLDLTGPSFTLHTACSTSLAAIHLAYRAILTGECDMALAGGVTVSHLSKSGYMYQEGMIGSSDGHCRTFDAGARGTVSGDGVGIVVLKRLEEALRDRDHIYAVIKGSALNNDGIKKTGFTAPGVEGQAEVIKTALQMAEVEPESISYIETHGTGTQLGDTVEIESLELAFDTDKKKFCAIGSVKSNIGHTDCAAGAAGFIKTVLAIYHKLIPPSLHFETPNLKIDFENNFFFVNTRLKEWKNVEYPLRAGISSFGIGGTNAHIILEEPPDTHHRVSSPTRDYQVILLSAGTGPALREAASNLARYFKKNPGINLADAAYTLQVGRRNFQYKTMLVCSSVNEAIKALSPPDTAKLKTSRTKEEEEEKPVIFMFPGLGSQYVNMGLGLYQNESVFREEMDRCFEILKPLLGFDLKEILYPASRDNRSNRSNESYNTHSSNINQTEIAQLLIFIFEYALAKLIMKWGIKPHAMIGYSLGEYTVACISGVFSLEHALKLIVLRGKLIEKMPTGVMLSVPLSQEELTPLLNNKLSIAVDNGPSCIISGPGDAVDAFENQMKGKKYICVRLQTSHALHSRTMEPILQEFEEKVAEFSILKEVQIPYISNLTGTWITKEDNTPAYWAVHLRETVRFADGIKELVKIPGAVFVEIGPGRDLSTLLLRHLEDKPDLKNTNLVRHREEKIPDNYFLLKRIGRLWLWGVKIDWNEFHAPGNRKRIALPTYPFERKRYWIEPIETERYPLKIGTMGLLEKNLTGKSPDIAGWFYIPSWKRTMAPGDESTDISSRWWLLFTDNRGLGSQLVLELKKRKQDVVIVKVGMVFQKESDFEFTINPGKEHDNGYDALFEELSRLKQFPDKIVHLWGITPPGYNHNELGMEYVEMAQNLGYYSLLNTVQAIGKKNPHKKIEITVVTNNMQEVTGDDGLCPEKATILGPVKSIPIEYANIKCRSIDVVLSKSKNSQKRKQGGQLFGELTAGFPDPVVALRGHHRWVQIFESIRLEKSPGKNPRLKQKGVYLITGGLGGIGLLLAKYLAKTVSARLILTGRSAFPSKDEWDRWLSTNDKDDVVSQKIRKIQELEKVGSKVLVSSADVTDEQQMQEVITRALAEFGHINGVIHSAGLPDGELIQRRAPGISERVLAAKVRGTLVLDRLLKDIKPDFLVLCSSISSIRAGIGHVGYCAANNFLDAFAKYKFFHEGEFNVSINWPRWQKVGIATIAENMHKKLTGEELADGISSEQGVEIFSRILEKTQPQVAVSAIDLMSQIEQTSTFEGSSLMKNLEERNFVEPGCQRPGLETEYAAPTNEIEQALAGIWSKFFGFEQLGIHDDFFELGGDSLSALVVITNIRKVLNVEVPITDFFNNPTIEKLAEYIKIAAKDEFFSIELAEEKEYYRLSSAQERIFIMQRMDLKSTSYNEQQILLLEGDLSKKKLEGALKQLINRHEALRTSIETVNGDPVQRIHPAQQVEPALAYYETGENETKKILDAFIKPFDLKRPPFLRLGLIKIAPKAHILVIDMHHIFADITSQELFFKDLMASYAGEELPSIDVQYRDFSEWQRRLSKSGIMAKQEDYWLNRFKNDIPVLNLPTDYPATSFRQSYQGKAIDFLVEKELTTRLSVLVKETETTFYMVLLAVCSILLSKYSEQEDIIVGSPVTGRRHADLHHIIGMFVNVLAMRNQPTGNKTFREFLDEVKENALNAYENQDYQFEELVRKLGLHGNNGRNPLFNVVFAVLNMERPATERTTPEIPGLILKPYHYEKKTTKFDLRFAANISTDNIKMSLTYSTGLFKEKTVQRMIERYLEIMEQVLKDRDIRLKDITISHDLLSVKSNTLQDYRTDFDFQV